MDKIRKKILKIDLGILDLISERMKLSKELGIMKKNKLIPVRNMEREKLLFENLAVMAAQQKLSPTLIKKIWKLLLNESIKLQKNSK